MILPSKQSKWVDLNIYSAASKKNIYSTCQKLQFQNQGGGRIKSQEIQRYTI